MRRVTVLAIHGQSSDGGREKNAEQGISELKSCKNKLIDLCGRRSNSEVSNHDFPCLNWLQAASDKFQFESVTSNRKVIEKRNFMAIHS